MSDKWAVADRVSKRITEVSNAEVDAMKAATGHADGIQILVGHLLALYALFKTMPEDAPIVIHALKGVVGITLMAFMKDDDDTPTTGGNGDVH